ncbi:Uncharacterized protein LOCC1_G007848 [Lachnellula occidentalis]|uniref:RBR-type E3 ubiquitin transferase n=1 Tax=Lachnellula occidentalis TaxID=215460 RepID=A0A8H8U7D0_9HELO|nr:Uncharacterized protein LOCC1_G007848 [Lachnellula occidentalis]
MAHILPGRIFGHYHKTYTKDFLCQILTHHKKRHFKRDSRYTLLAHLIALEATLAVKDYILIRIWLGQHDLQRQHFSSFVADRENASGEDSPDGEDVPHLKRRKVMESATFYGEDDSEDDSEGELLVANLRGLPSPAISVPPATIDCAVCMESLEPESFSQPKITPSCDHETQICDSCATQSIDIQILEFSWDMIKCPLCPELMSFESIKEIASEEAFQRYDRKSVIAAFRHMPNFTYCLNAGCDSGQIHGGGDDQPIMTCTECQFKTCFTHETAWHSGMTCSEYDEVLAKDKKRTKQEAASQKYLTKKTKICPNPKCGLHCIKVDGCDHMTCHSCHFQFCWSCFASYTRIRAVGNTAHSKKCPWHPKQLNKDGVRIGRR